MREVTHKLQLKELKKSDFYCALFLKKQTLKKWKGFVYAVQTLRMTKRFQKFQILKQWRISHSKRAKNSEKISKRLAHFEKYRRVHKFKKLLKAWASYSQQRKAKKVESKCK